MPLPRFNVERAPDMIVEYTNLNMIGLVVGGYVATIEMQDQVDALRVGDSQLSDKDGYYITRVS